MNDKQRTTVRADIKKNRLYITLSSPVNKSKLDKIYTDVRFCVADLQPGFDVITDLSQCSVGHLSGISTLRKIMSFLVIHKVGRVIRIIGEMSLLLKQLMGMAARFQGYKPIYVASIEEAEEELERPIKPSALRFQINQRQIEFSTQETTGAGSLIDISTSGCAVHGATCSLAPDDHVDMVIPLHDAQEELCSFTMSGRVVSAREDGFAVQFVAVEEEQKKHLYECLMSEMKREMQ